MTSKTLTCQVTSVEDLTPDVFRVHLTGRREAIAHAPGQYLELKLDEQTWVPFSIANAHADDGVIELHVQHWPERSNSARLRELLVHAARLTVRLPNGGCVLDTRSRRPLTLIAAGTGFAQMKAIVEAALANDHPGPIRLWWAVKSPRDLYLESLALEWAATHPHLDVHTVVEDSEPALSAPAGVTRHIGRIDEVLAECHGDISGDDVYLSGSPGMVYACIDTLAPLGLDPERVFSDVFAYAPRVPLIPLPEEVSEKAPLSPGERRAEDDA
ncbi:NAD(P)H-flavin reductase [Chromohalobacter israelensis]|uniref:Oxidoreductase FAD/NAD(P)-binding protein n=1 Tax=Chromohalobacter israelensis (strain ATCC BAA-138 / DSM 3043 / CIP 106854 / NCIMB 13768 / 1H11) TaxID=290398 RepID=Q1R010_CHRI1|nr:NAD(P)H-flavin reductase [Chromohalobacter salexigens]ABE57948.1 oxidoreductase FAD/NAD(P)-binding protein [Chromohalobacter salexigens DSM 3043]